jgi:hypothetical protein
MQGGQQEEERKKEEKVEAIHNKFIDSDIVVFLFDLAVIRND